ncbi:MAG: YciI family protein [Vicinamibacterales bacterium]
MKFMLQMNVKKGPYQMEGWSQDDVKRMVGFMHQLNADLSAKGQLVSAEGLVAPEQTRVVKANDAGSPIVTDGPFAESKEFIAGYWIVEVTSADEAYAIAAQASACPGPGGKPLNMPIELREVGTPPPVD